MISLSVEYDTPIDAAMTWQIMLIVSPSAQALDRLCCCQTAARLQPHGLARKHDTCTLLPWPAAVCLQAGQAAPHQSLDLRVLLPVPALLGSASACGSPSGHAAPSWQLTHSVSWQDDRMSYQATLAGMQQVPSGLEVPLERMHGYQAAQVLTQMTHVPPEAG